MTARHGPVRRNGLPGGTGWPQLTLRRGEVVYRDGEVSGTPGSGELVRRERWRGPPPQADGAPGAQD